MTLGRLDGVEDAIISLNSVKDLERPWIKADADNMRAHLTKSLTSVRDADPESSEGKRIQKMVFAYTKYMKYVGDEQLQRVSDIISILAEQKAVEVLEGESEKLKEVDARLSTFSLLEVIETLKNPPVLSSETSGDTRRAFGKHWSFARNVSKIAISAVKLADRFKESNADEVINKYGEIAELMTNLCVKTQLDCAMQKLKHTYSVGAVAEPLMNQAFDELEILAKHAVNAALDQTLVDAKTDEYREKWSLQASRALPWMPDQQIDTDILNVIDGFITMGVNYTIFMDLASVTDLDLCFLPSWPTIKITGRLRLAYYFCFFVLICSAVSHVFR